MTRSEFPVQQIKATVPAEVVIGKRFLRCLEALLELPEGMHHAAGCLAIECRNPNYKPWQVWVYQFKNEGLSDLESNEVKLVKGSESTEQQGIVEQHWLASTILNPTSKSSKCNTVSANEQITDHPGDTCGSNSRPTASAGGCSALQAATRK